MQPGLNGAHRNARKFLNFCEFIALGVVQQHDQAMLITELLERLVQLLHLLEALVILSRVLGAGQPFEAVAREHAFLNRMQSLAREAPLLVNEQVVHNAAKPRARLVDLHEVIDFAVRLDEELLEQVLGFGFAARQAPGKTIQPVEMRPDEAFERVAMLSDAWLLPAVTAAPANG